jgi:hypothetical protein
VDDQNQTAPSTAPADGADKPADSGTGTIFAPATSDPTVNPYDMAQPAGETPAIGTPAPVFAQPASPTDDKSAPNVGAAPLNSPTSASLPTAEPAAPTPAAPAADGDLMAIKQAALQNLTPLVDELPQTPEDKFKTMMMLIQASDNSALIKKAYDAANTIRDEKTRAQALLDVVNEINYFTQQKTPKKSS